MKVLYVYDDMPKTYQTYMWNTLTALKKEISATSFSYQPNPKADLYFKNSIAQKLKRKIVSQNESEIIASQWIGNYDIIHLQHSYLFPKLESLLNPQKENNNPKVIITLRGGDTYIKPWVFKKWKKLYHSWIDGVSQFVVVSKHQKEYLADHWEVPLDKISVIPISVAPHFYNVPKMPSKKVLKIASAHRMTWEKNIDAHLRTVMTLKEMGHTIQYDIYGDGPDLGELYYLVNKYQLTDIVRHFSKISNDVLLEKLPSYDFFLQLSLSEALSASVLEAQSCGVPAIVSNVGGLPEAIIHGKTGYCVHSWEVNEAAKSMVELFQNQDRYFEFSKEAIRHVEENFGVHNEVDKLIQLYKSFI